MEGSIQLKLTILCLIIAGVWPIKFKFKTITLLYAVYFNMALSFFVVFVFSQYIELFMIFGKSLEELSGLMATNFVYMLGILKVWVVRGTTIKNLINTIQVTEENIFKSGENKVKEIFMEHAVRNYNANRLMIFLGGICWLMFCLTPKFEELVTPLDSYFGVTDNNTMMYKKRYLPLVSWFPYDRYKYYGVSYSWHVLIALIGTVFIVACDNLVFSLMTFATGQLKILQYNLENIRLTRNSNGPQIREDLIIKENLRKCVIYHIAIIRFVQHLNKSMRLYLLVDFAGCALQFAMIGFEVAVAELSFQLLKNILYLATMITQLFLLYWHGNEVRLESINVVTALWNSEWYLYNVSNQRTLLQIMVRSQRSLKLSIGPFYEMSTETMIMILKSAYTYTTVMRRFYSSKMN